jgi:hypothetical protein
MNNDTSHCTQPPDQAPVQPPIHKEGEELLIAIKRNLEELKKLLKDSRGHWAGEDCFYRFYHGSLKVYWVQKYTEKMVKIFLKISEESGLKDRGLNKQFLSIINDGTGKTFDLSHNQDWDKHTRPILEAFFHSREMLSHMVHYGTKLDHAPNMLPSGWAAVLYLFNIR